jgi:hypothetical protein
MAEKYYFFDETATDLREYNADDYSKYFRQFLSDGVYKKDAISNLGVTASGTNMTVSVGVGTAFVQGYMYENDAALTLTHDAAEATLDRIDRIVLRLDKTAENRYVRLFVKKGTAASSPVAPSLQQDSFIHEIAIAQVRITAGKSFIEQTQVTDERAYVVMLESMYAKKQQEAWINAVLQNGWKNTAGFATAQYMKDELGFVHIKGVVDSGTTTAGTVILTLPAGYRPKEKNIFSVPTYSGTSDTHGRIDVWSDGTVAIYTGGSGYLSLSVPPFRAE